MLVCGTFSIYFISKQINEMHFIKVKSCVRFPQHLYFAAQKMGDLNMTCNINSSFIEKKKQFTAHKTITVYKRLVLCYG